MKIKTIIFLLVTFLMVTEGKAQIAAAEIIYKMKINKSPKDSSKISNLLKLVIHDVGLMELKLLFKENKSIFEEVELMDVDDKRKSIRKMAKTVTEIGGAYFCDLDKRVIIRGKEFDGKKYQIISSFDKIDWKLINESKTINNFECFKATTTKTFISRKGNIINLDVTAWYTSTIPIPLGPKNYVGLPGLIMELHEGNNRIIFYASKVDLKPKIKLDFEKLQNGIELTEDEFAELTRGAAKKWVDSKKQ